jgi:hypothetical protein
MNPLIVAGCIGKAVNLLLGDLVPVADANLGANRGFEILEVAKDAHLFVSFSAQALAETLADDPFHGLHNDHFSRVLGSKLFK